jgi:hypothetical protein
MPSPYTQVADAVKAIIDAEYLPEGYTAIHDNLHPAVGAEGTRVGIAPEEEAPRGGNMIQNEIAVTVKFYRRWDPDVDPTKKVDPRPITEFAERFRNAVRVANAGGSDSFWYFNVVRIRYPNDPVGNKTRFEADLVAFGTNSALSETTG